MALYPYITQGEGLAAIKNALKTRDNKSISTESSVNLVDCVLKNNIFEHHQKLYKQKQGTAIGTKMALPYAFIFMGELEKKILAECSDKPLVLWQYIGNIFMIWQHGE